VNAKNFFAELKRRNVYKVAIAYAVVAWLLMQIATQVFPFLEIPNWAIRLVIMLLALGFPIALILAWAFELTPEGIKRAEDVDLSKPIVPKTGWRLTVIIIAIVVLALSLLVFQLTRSHPAVSVAKPVAVPNDKSVAVLPFANLSRDPDNAYFAAGIQDEIITRLAKITELKVISCTSTQRFKSAPDDLPAIAKQLGVTNILEGSVQRTADQVRVNVQLIKAETDAHLWADTFDRKLTDVFQIESEIAKTVAETLQAKLSGSEQHAIAARPTENTEAHQLYLKGRFFWDKRTSENLKKSINYFDQAVAADPNYALAYVGLADCYLLLEDYVGTPASETYPKAEASAQRALQLDSSLAEAHTSLAYVYSNLWQWEQAEEEFKRAIKLNPNYPTAHHWYSLYLLDLGRIDEAMAEIKRAHELDPLSLIIGTTLNYAYFAEGDVNSSIAQCQRVIDLDPNFPRAHEYLGLGYLTQGRYSEAIVELQKAVELSGRDRRPLRDLGYGYAASGKRAEALTVLKEIEGNYEKHKAIGQDFAAVYAGLGEKDQAFAWLEKDFQARSGLLAWSRWTPPFDSLRGDPRFADLLRRMWLKP
jgi:TolB-like protein/tetratricopeptide (TPR) repeat protein